MPDDDEGKGDGMNSEEHSRILAMYGNPAMDPTDIWYAEPSDHQMECLFIRIYGGSKNYLRIWFPSEGQRNGDELSLDLPYTVDLGWNVSANAVRVGEETPDA